ncbi:hypothetical protein DDZ14_16050 [Maritimibacter sp. 55A14]|uniref:helix-turn-helix domain-containing protein n=1 Tax=Maritimibacter sp. 55A14 TaxID=2174844 RepID=UPI000D61C3B7|nr:helix-turn-helix domain-containing protein [Maritimibacter sp. 55A14]PWE29953.1 hypothetical protein DDZ14_16050 [Maritimibacter sp. 55A14]
MSTLRWKSNNQAVADRKFTIAEVENGEIRIMPDPAEGRLVPVYIHAAAQAAPAPSTINSDTLPQFAPVADFSRAGDGVRSDATFDRHFINGMTEAEAVTYLLQVIELMMHARLERLALLIDAAGKTPEGKNYIDRATGQTFLILWDGQGRTLTYDYISTRLEQEMGSFFDSTGIASRVKRLRAAITALEWPVEIETSVGVGYKMTAPTEWIVPWDARQPAALAVG